MNKRIYYNLLLIWILCLSIYFIWNIWNIFWVVKVCVSILITVILGFIGYRNQYWQQSNLVDHLQNLPTARKIVLVAGDDVSSWIEAGQPWRLFRDTMWVNITDYSQLISVYQTLDQQNRIPASIFLILNPEKYPHIAALEQNISQWRQEIETIQSLYKRRLPISLGIHTDLNHETILSWPENISNQICRSRAEAKEYFTLLQKQMDILAALDTDKEHYLPYETTSSLYLSQSWLIEYVIKNLLPEKSYHNSVLIMSCVWINSFSANSQADWRQYEIAKTGLVTPSYTQSNIGLKAFPKIETDLIRPLYLSQGNKYLCYAFSWLLIFYMLATVYSFSENRQWLEQVQAAHQQYIAIPEDKENDRIDAIKNLKLIQQTLQDYQAYGEPKRMGLGLYHATKALPIINNDINSFRLVKKEKQIIMLDTTALFDVGESKLKPDAKLVLQGVLTWIQANPNKRVLIDGHTDNTGSVDMNQTLSFNRARSVKEWLVTASTFPENHFTVQGFGDSKPIAENDSAEGRSKNRRVEITLVDITNSDQM